MGRSDSRLSVSGNQDPCLAVETGENRENVNRGTDGFITKQESRDSAIECKSMTKWVECKAFCIETGWEEWRRRAVEIGRAWTSSYEFPLNRWHGGVDIFCVGHKDAPFGIEQAHSLARITLRIAALSFIETKL